MPTSQDHSPGRAKLFRDELLRKRHATQNNALSRQRPAATVLSEGKFAAMFVTDLGAVPMRPRGAGGIVCADTRAPISVLAGSDLPRAGGGHLCSNLLARINRLPRTARVRLLRTSQKSGPILWFGRLSLCAICILHLAQSCTDGDQHLRHRRIARRHFHGGERTVM